MVADTLQEKIYVAGHLGMVGSAIVRALKQAGHEHIVIAPLFSRLRVARLVDGSYAEYAFIGSIERLKRLQMQTCSCLVLDGYFQDPELSLSEFDRQNLFAKLAAEFSYLLETAPVRSNLPRVGIHIRRGDYITSKDASNVFKTIPIEYYRTAIKKLSFNNLFLIFGDDPALTNALAKEINGVDINSLGFSTKEEFMLLSLCDHYIIANSTFSWWASYLGYSNTKRVISPRNWYFDQERSEKNPLLMPYFEILEV